jgi:primosomal replication protein N
VNQLVLNARIAEASAMRYTPAGLPALDIRLEHESSIEEAGQQRQVSLALRAVAFGSLAERLVHQQLGSSWQFTGFLVTPRGYKHIVFHIHSFQIIS